MKRMLALCPTYFPMMGGAERTVDEIYTRISKLGYKVDLVTPNMGGKKYEKKGKFSIYRVGKQTNNRILKFFLYQWKEYKKIKKLLKKRKYDLINISYGFPNCLLIPWLRWKIKAPLVITEFHLGTGMDIVDESQNPPYVNPVLKHVYRNADAITAISNDQKKFVEKVSGRDDVTVVFQGTNEKYFNPKKKDEKIKKKYKIGSPFLLTVSRLNARKNIGDQIRAMSIVVKKFPAVTLAIAGRGEEKGKIERLIAKLNLEKNCIFTGFVPDKELPKLYATADVFLLTSKLEGFGIANAEALASGTPVVTYDTKAAGDYIIEGKTGFITKHSPKKLAEKIIKVLSDEKLLKKMSLNARKMVEGKYTWDIYTKNHKKIFDEVLNVSNN